MRVPRPTLRSFALALCWCAVACFVCWFPALLTRRAVGPGDWIFLHNDLSTVWAAWSRFGEWAQWNPYQCVGTSLVHRIHTPVYSPLLILLAPFGALAAIKVFVALWSLIGFSGAYFFCRHRLGFGSSTAMVAAWVYGASGTFVGLVMDGELWVLCFYALPLVALLAPTVVERWSSFACFLLLAVVVTWGGGVEVLPWMFVVVAAVRFAAARGPRVRRGQAFGWVRWAIMVLLCAVVAFSRVAPSLFSPWTVPTAPPTSLWAQWGSILGYGYGQGVVGYVGVAASVLAVLGLVRLWVEAPGRATWTVVFFVFCPGLCWTLTWLGWSGATVGWGVLCAAVMGILVAYGLEGWRIMGPFEQRTRVEWTVLIVVVLFAESFFVVLPETGGWVSSKPHERLSARGYRVAAFDVANNAPFHAAPWVHSGRTNCREGLVSASGLATGYAPQLWHGSGGLQVHRAWRTANRFFAEFTSDRGGTVVVNQTHHAGWRAPGHSFRLRGDLSHRTTFDVEAGRHRVQMLFEPMDTDFVWCSLGMVLCVAFFVLPWPPVRRRLGFEH